MGGEVERMEGEQADGNKWAVQKQFCQQPRVGRNGSILGMEEVEEIDVWFGFTNNLNRLVLLQVWTWNKECPHLKGVRPDQS